MNEQENPQLNPYLMTHDGWTLDPQNRTYAEALRTDDSALNSYLAGIAVLSGTDAERIQDPLADIVVAESADTDESRNSGSDRSDGNVPTIRTGFEIHDNWDLQ